MDYCGIDVGFLGRVTHRSEEKLNTIACGLPEGDHLRRIPGVGLLTALSFVLSIDDPERFRRRCNVPAFFGLRPTVSGSGDVKHYGKITKQENPEIRRLLVQAAHAMMNSKKDCHLKQWAAKVAARRGKAKATVALARNIAALMHHLWITGKVFRPFPSNVKKAACKSLTSIYRRLGWVTSWTLWTHRRFTPASSPLNSWKHPPSIDFPSCTESNQDRFK